jgi:hypothetical protein
MHGLSQSALPNSRDRNYHRGLPGRAGFDKGHAMSHAQGGREGGPNYFPQAPRVNRRLSPLGALWRDIESYLAANPGLFCFVRLAYPRVTSTDVPDEVEYGVDGLLEHARDAGAAGQSSRWSSRSSRSPATFSISLWSFCDARCLAWMRADRLTFSKSP